MQEFEEIKEHVKEKHTFPKYRCTTCRFEVQLDFDPTKEFEKMFKFQCSQCEKRNVEEPI